MRPAPGTPPAAPAAMSAPGGSRHTTPAAFAAAASTSLVGSKATLPAVLATATVPLATPLAAPLAILPKRRPIFLKLMPISPFIMPCIVGLEPRFRQFLTSGSVVAYPVGRGDITRAQRQHAGRSREHFAATSARRSGQRPRSSDASDRLAGYERLPGARRHLRIAGHLRVCYAERALHRRHRRPGHVSNAASDASVRRRGLRRPRAAMC